MSRVHAPRRLLAGLVVAVNLAVVAPAQAVEPYEERIDLTFPTVADARFIDDYHQARGGGRVHRATDLMVPKHTPAYAAVDGRICYINGIDEPMPSWGYSLSICDAKGRKFNYVHLNNDTPGSDDGEGGPEHAYAPGIRRGVEVTRGQLVGWIGDSGNAESTASHLHFEIDDPSITDPYGSHRRNPFRSLRAAVARGDVPDGSGRAPADQPSTAPAETAPSAPTTRVAGSDRVATAIELSRSTFERAAVTVLAPASSPSQAIIGGPLAAALGGPVLTTDPQRLDPRVVTELRRLGTRQVVTIGLPPRIAAALQEAGVEVERIGGADLFATARAVAERVWQAHGVSAAGASRSAILALGTHPDPSRAWPDSLMASYYGAATGQPVLLVAHDGLPSETADALSGVAQVTVIGGPAAVSRTTTEAVRERGPQVRRLFGVTRYSTALAVSDALVRRGEVSPARTWAATGRNWPDAATSGPVIARNGDLLVLVDGQAEGGDGETRDYVSHHAAAVERVVGIGGVKAVADRALGWLAAWAS